MRRFNGQSGAFLKRSVRGMLVAVAVGLAMLTSLQVRAHSALTVDLPVANAPVSNGDSLVVGGWTSGTRVDVYLDGPAGVGAGIGSSEVGAARHDVANATGIAGLATSGFDVAWQPLQLTAGAHTLYVYSLVDGEWMMETTMILGRGNDYFPVVDDRDSSKGDDDALAF